MTAGPRALWNRMQASYWFLPTVLTIAAFGGALLTVHLDHMWSKDWLDSYAGPEFVRPDGARAQLTIAASAMIAIASTVFSITIAAVAFASANYGPRLLNNFMSDRGNQFSLGVFVATFVYNIIVLRSVRGADESAGAGFVPQLSLLVSAGTVLLAVGVLVYFLHHVPASIRINSVLAGIGRHLLADIDERYPAGDGDSETEPVPPGITITAPAAGYVEIIDFDELDEFARKHGAVFSLRIRTGDFVHPAIPLLESSGGTADRAELSKTTQSAFCIGDMRSREQDLDYLFDELVEIGLRALSPGVNDPFTAISCLHWLGAATARLAERELCRGPDRGSYDARRVRALADDFGHYLDRGFGAMRLSVAGSPIAAKVCLEMLDGVASAADSEERRGLVQVEAATLVEQAGFELRGPALADLRRYAATLAS